VYIEGTNFEHWKRDDVITFLENKIDVSDELLLKRDGYEFLLKKGDIDFEFYPRATVHESYRDSRSLYNKNTLSGILDLIGQPKNYEYVVGYNESLLGEYVLSIAGQVNEEGFPVSFEFVEGAYQAKQGRSGMAVDVYNFEKHIAEAFVSGKSSLEIPVKLVNHTLSDDRLGVYENRLNVLSGKKIQFIYKEGLSQEIVGSDGLLLLIDPNGGFKLEEIDNLLTKHSERIERPAKNAVLIFVGDRVDEFWPAQTGIEIRKESFINDVSEALFVLSHTDQSQVDVTIKTNDIAYEYGLDEINDLGINGLIGVGESWFRGSIPARVYNISHASEKINATILAPGEEFSFNGVLGDVSSYTGYKKAYIIKEGETILGDGGGVCQVSTTLFRAALDSGLKITKRSPHSYRVSYYEQGSKPGFDATVYQPYPDLKFVNDTNGHLLIQSFFDSTLSYLKFEIYGTDDGRVVSISDPVVLSSTPPPDDLYIDDPTLPSGQIKQVEHKAWGSKMYFDYVVVKDEVEIIKKRFYSNYQPWQAVYLVGVGL
jgi:vancomycin resistance protein YoaR